MSSSILSRLSGLRRINFGKASIHSFSETQRRVHIVTYGMRNIDLSKRFRNLEYVSFH